MLLWSLVLGAIIIAWLIKLNSDYYILAFFARRLKTIDGSNVPSPTPTTIFGHTFDWFNYKNETALGVKLDEHLDSEKYRKSFNMIDWYFVKRIANPWFSNDQIFKFFHGRELKVHIDTVHQFSSAIIEKRRQLYANEMKNNNEPVNNGDESSAKEALCHARQCHTLLNAERDGLIDHDGICEEVDTFMFEDFDTTSMGLIFSIMNFSLYQEWQERCYNEIMENITGDFNQLDISQISSLTHLDCFVKESLRLFPSTPTVQRETLRQTKIGNIILPAGTQILIHFFDIMRDPRHFSKANEFNPERFTPENSSGRHAFAYTPFSAGMRNCIGQKFAMLEMKTLLIYLLKQYKVLPMMEYPLEKGFEAGLIIRTQENIKDKLEKRQ